MSLINKIAYTEYPVTDLKRSVEFYEKTLGLRLLFVKEGWAEFDVDGQRLALHSVQKKSNTEELPGPVVSFLSRPIENTIQALKGKGVKFVGGIEVFSYGKLARFLDPDGNTLGLYEPPPVS